MVEEVKKGFYKHFKGFTCEVIGVGVHTETLEKFVVYIHKTDENEEGIWVRPVEMFLDDKILEDGSKVKRFEYIGDHV